MRTSIFTGLALLAGGLAIFLLGSSLDLELESTALMGVAIGAVLALVPDRTPSMRLAGFVGGFVAAWIAYFIRAALLPDTTGGRAVALALVMVLCVAVAVVTLNRIGLWTSLLGAATLAGAYESTYAAAPSEVVDTSVTAVTTVLLTVAVGFLATSLAAPQASAAPAGSRPVSGDHDNLDSMMEPVR